MLPSTQDARDDILKVNSYTTNQEIVQELKPSTYNIAEGTIQEVNENDDSSNLRKTTPIDQQISVTDVEELKDIAMEMDKPETSSDPAHLELSGKPESSSNPTQRQESSNPMEPTSSEYKQLRTNDFDLSESGLNVERKISLNPNPLPQANSINLDAFLIDNQRED